MPLINCKINLYLNLSKKCIIVATDIANHVFKDPSFQGVNRLLVLSFEDNAHCSVMIDGQNVFDKPVKNNWRTYDSTQIIATGQECEYATGCFLDYYFKNYYKMIARDLSKQEALVANPKAIQNINFAWNVESEGNPNTAMFFIIEEAKETVLDISQGTVKVF